MRELYSKLRLFEQRFPHKKIQLSSAKSYLEELLETPILDSFMKQFLLDKGYAYIEEHNHAADENHSAQAKQDNDDDELDFSAIIKEEWKPKRTPKQKPQAKASYDSNTQLLQDFHAGKNTEYSRKSLIENNLRLVHKVASRYVNYISHKLSYEDLVSEGTIGLMKAIERYNVTMGTQFSTYAIWWIRQAIQRAILETGTTVRIPVHMFETIIKVKKTENRYLATHQEIIPELVCDELCLTRAAYDKIKAVEHQFLSLTSLDQFVTEEDQETSLGDFVSGELRFVVGGLPDLYHDPSLLAEQGDIRSRMQACLEKLEPRERDILIERFGLLDNVPKTLEEIGQLYGVTRERIRQIETRALNRMRSHIMKRMSKEDWYWPQLSNGG